MNSEAASVAYKDIKLLHDTFLLFGDSNAPYWFLGLEETAQPDKEKGIDDFVHHLLRRTEWYRDAGQLSLRSLCAPEGGYSFMPKIEESGARTGKNVKYQATWGGYIKLLLSVEMYGAGKSWSIEDVKQYQKYNLGELTDSEDLPKSCLMELFPMARKGRKKGHWPYSILADRQDMEFMKTPSSYQAYAEKNRIETLLSLVKEHEPKYLFCFGSDCKKALMSQIDETPQAIRIDQGKKEIEASFVILGKTRILFSNHPTSHGISNLYWKNLGAELASME